jgi:transcriptional regulator with XRE-family HTH domain
MDATAARRLDPTDRYVGRRIRMRRMMLGLSQTALGDAADVTFQQVQKYEKGVNRVSASRMQQFAKVLAVPVSFFFEGAPAPKLVGGKPSGKNGGMPDYVQDFLATRDGVRLASAFSRITDRKLRRAVIDLLEQAG